MTTILAHLTIKPGKEAAFEDIAREMVRQTTGNEPGCVRYEYWRGQDARNYYVLLAFRDSGAFYEHQASDWHEQYTNPLRDCWETIRLEILDPVPGASPLSPTVEQPLPDDAPEAQRRHEAAIPITRAAWWDSLG